MTFSRNGTFELSYTYYQTNNNIIKVKFSAEYSSQTSYENRYEPYVECESSLEVTNTNDQYYIDKANHDIPCQLYVNGDEVESQSWAYLINKIIYDIEGEENELYKFLDFK